MFSPSLHLRRYARSILFLLFWLRLFIIIITLCRLPSSRSSLSPLTASLSLLVFPLVSTHLFRRLASKVRRICWGVVAARAGSATQRWSHNRSIRQRNLHATPPRTFKEYILPFTVFLSLCDADGDQSLISLIKEIKADPSASKNDEKTGTKRDV